MKSYNNQFAKFLRTRKYSERTVSSYCFLAEKFDRVLNSYECQYDDVISAVAQAHYSIRYRQVIVASLRIYFSYLVESGQRNNHPCPYLRIRPNYEQNFIEADFLTGNELRLLQERDQRYGFLVRRDRLIMSLLTIQGLAAVEVTRLKLHHIDLAKRIVIVHRSRKNAGRRLALVSRQVQLFREYLEQDRPKIDRHNSDGMILGKLGTTLTQDSIHYLVSTLQPLVPGKKLTPMLIRQSVIVRWINELKIPLEQVQLMCGHRSITTTEKYRFHSFEKDVKMVNRWL